jgi:hypothetical protein
VKSVVRVEKKDAVLQENVKLYKDFTVIVTSNPRKI